MGATAKGGKVHVPDYGPVASAMQSSAQLYADTSREQLAWAKEQYGKDREVSDRVINTLLPQMQAQGDAAAADRKRYVEKYQPLEDQQIADAQSYASPDRMELEAGRAGAGVASQFDAQRQAAQAQLESFGIDPSQTRAAALDLGTRVAQAAAGAGAQNQSRLNTENTGRALRGEAINVGKGYPGQVAQSYATSQNAGNSAVSNGLNTTGSGAGSMGTGAQWGGLNSSVLGSWGGQTAGMAGNAINANTARYGQFASMVGSAVGGMTSLGTAALMAKKDGGPIPHDPEDPEGNKDRVAIRVSGDEFVIPASVVRAKGTDFFERLIMQVGKKGDAEAAAQRRQTGSAGGQRAPAMQGV